MAIRRFKAVDNEAMKIDSSSPYGRTGQAIINNSDTPNGTIFKFTGGHEDRVIRVRDTSRNTNKFNDDDENNHVIVDGKGIVEDGARVESESKIYVQKVDDYGWPTGPVIKITVFSKGGNTSDVWGFATNKPLEDGARYMKVSGSNKGDSNYMDFSDPDGVPCFTKGTLIATPSGPREVETLSAGDLVLTYDRGPQPVQWATATQTALTATSTRHPISIDAGALGPDLPLRELTVSPQHRILLKRDGAEVFAPAKALTALPGIRIQLEQTSVTYVHILLASHAVVLSEGLATESFFPGPMAIAALSEENRRSLALQISGSTAYQRTCRSTLTVRETREWLGTLTGPDRHCIGSGHNAPEKATTLSA